MITKNDCLTMLVALEDSGINIDVPMKELVLAKEPPVSVLKFIAQNRGFWAVDFYEMLRRRSNQHKSPLYKNMLNYETADDIEVSVILSSLLTQINLYSQKLESDSFDAFFREIRVKEIIKALGNYYETGTSDVCRMVLKLIKSDVLVLEYLAGRRELV